MTWEVVEELNQLSCCSKNSLGAPHQLQGPLALDHSHCPLGESPLISLWVCAARPPSLWELTTAARDTSECPYKNNCVYALGGQVS